MEEVTLESLARQALLLSANRRDFEQVPGLRVENWLEQVNRTGPWESGFAPVWANPYARR